MHKKLKVAAIVFFLVGSIAFVWHYKTSTQQPNIILITLDALRADHLGCYGYPRATSPTIDNLAQHGIIFTHSIAQSSQTAPSNASLITSTYPNVHHVRSWGYPFSPRTSNTLPVILKKYGYSTALISDQTVLTLIKGFEKGFDTFNTIRSFFLPGQKRIIEITDWAISWLKNNRRKKFFLWLYYLSPHGPYLAPAPYDKMFIHDKFYTVNKTVPISDGSYLGPEAAGIGEIPQYMSINGIRDVDYYISQYDAEIRRVDDQIARLLEELKNNHLDKNTIIIINSDHGEALGEHNRYFVHGHSLYDELIRTPLIMYWNKKIVSGRKIDQQVRTIDVMPTILDMLKIRFSGMQGESLLPLMMQKTNDFQTFAYSERLSLVSIRTNGWKLILDQDKNQYEFYDLKNDPKELNNIAAKETAVFKLLQQRLDHYRSYSRKPNNPAKSLEKENLEILRSLGYTQ